MFSLKFMNQAEITFRAIPLWVLQIEAPFDFRLIAPSYISKIYFGPFRKLQDLLFEISLYDCGIENPGMW